MLRERSTPERSRRHHSGVSASAMATAISRHATRTHHLHNGCPRPCRLVHTAASAPCERKRYEPARCSRPGIAAPSHHKFSAAERDELYREFQKWRERPTTE